LKGPALIFAWPFIFQTEMTSIGPTETMPLTVGRWSRLTHRLAHARPAF
jgi:hypothetical protein